MSFYSKGVSFDSFVLENEEEVRIKTEIRKILEGEIDDVRAKMRRGTQVVPKERRTSVLDEKNEETTATDELEGEENEVVTVVGKVEV